MDRIGVVELNKNCGIYKITSPVGKVYIGQSSDIKNRFKVYQRLSCKQQVKLYNSLKKYGVENHQFDIIEYCSEEDLNCSERFWQDEFGGLCKNTLNCLLQECGEERRTHGEESRRKMSQNSKSKGTRLGIKLENASANPPNTNPCSFSDTLVPSAILHASPRLVQISPMSRYGIFMIICFFNLEFIAPAPFVSHALYEGYSQQFL